MTLTIFNWLCKRMPYASALFLLNILWAIFIAGIFVAMLVLYRADFEVTGTERIFLASLTLGLVIVVLVIIPIKGGLMRIFGSHWGEIKEVRILNDYTKKGHLSSDISNRNLLELFNTLKNITLIVLKLGIKCNVKRCFLKEKLLSKKLLCLVST